MHAPLDHSPGVLCSCLRLVAARSLRAVLPCIALLSLLASAPARAGEPACPLDGLPAFAGHQLPLEGSPDPQPMSLVDAFPELSFDDPVFLAFAPVAEGADDDRLFVVERRGVIRVFDNDPASDVATVVLDIDALIDSDFNEQGLLGLAFDPDFPSNRRFYVNYTTDQGCDAEAPQTWCTKIVRYEMRADDPDVADPASAELLYEVPQFTINHNGGMLAFGPDGLLYVAVGDGGGANDPQDHGRNLATPLGALLRLDVRDGAPSLVPADNPYAGQAGLAGEIFHSGLRNPWRFSFDRLTGDLWIGDVGQGAWEEIDYVAAGHPGGLDFGWDFCEGTNDVHGHDCDSIASTPPVVEYPHDGTGGFSVTGGYVYRGDRFPELFGAYLYSDYVSRRVWALAGPAAEPEQIATAPDGIASFGEDRSGELYLLALEGTIYRLEGSGEGVGAAFPTLLSQTGLFEDVATLAPAAGLVEYDVTSPLWSDGALKQRWIALPAGGRVAFHAREPWAFPVGTAFVKHFSLVDGASERRLETRVFLRQTERWVGVTYRWEGADALLLTEALDEQVTVGALTRDWHYPSPSECLGCHSRASGRVLGVRTRQHGESFPYPAGAAVQLAAWSCGGLFDLDVRDPARYDRYASLDDAGATRTERARSHLASNCAICHQPGGPAPGSEDLRFDPPLSAMQLFGVRTTEGDLGLFEPDRVAPGAHEDSALWVRMASLDETIRMAAGTRVPDAEAVALFADWIDQDVAVLDSDGDGEEDASDVCPVDPDPGQADGDQDGVGDACDPDLRADLTLAGLSLPTSILPGEPFAASGTARNTGVAAAGDFPLLFHLSADDVLDPGIDPAVAHCWIEGLGAGATAACATADGVGPALPEGVASRTLHWIACADRIDVVREADEGDNCAVHPGLVRLPAPSARAAAGAAFAALLALRGLRRARAARAGVSASAGRRSPAGSRR